jgi:hypothetical protein
VIILNSLKERVEEIEKEAIIKALNECGWVMQERQKTWHNRKDNRLLDT